MATATTVAIQWAPEDDLLLKNSVEAGASLEALAKGAVLFSRRYTLRELQERWHSLLYDPDISAQAAAQIFELEISGFNSISRFNRFDIGSKEGPRKRKNASIRRQYLAMRKKFRSELFSNSSLGFFEPSPHEFSEQSADFQKQRCMIGDGIPEHLGLHEEDLDILRHAFPGTVMEITSNVTSSLTEGVNNMLDLDIRNCKHPLTLRESSIDENPQNLGFEGGQRFSPSISDRPNLRHWRTMQDASASSVPLSMILHEPAPIAEGTTVCTGEFADPDSLLNLSNEDEMLEDVDEKYPANQCGIDDTGSVVQDSINDAAKTELESVTVAEAIPATISSPKPMVTELTTPSIHQGQQMIRQVDASSNSALISHFNGVGDGKIWCTLNTEDMEIPCNDDIFLLIHPSTSFGSSSTQPNNTFAHEEDYKQALSFSMRANGSAKGFGWPHMASMHGLPQSHVEIHDSRPQASLSGFVTKTVADSSKGGSQYAIPKQCSNSLAKKEVPGADIKVGQSLELVTKIIRSMEAGSARSQHPESVVDDSVSDDEESEIDDEVPYFSDIEAMILEMDLDPYDRDSSILRQVPSYQYDDTKRTIIRLEQGVRSCLQRAMTSQEALAILYGRHLRHYIRKTEVLLGRSTDDIDVDIDLSKEGRANKISRRQAIIKMEADGSFFLKNLGKSSVSVNGVAVASGHSLKLNTNCLIEIKGMSFVFEINQDYIRKHLGNFCLKNKGKTGKSDRSAEDES